MKRFLAILLALLLVTTLFGCGSQDTPNPSEGTEATEATETTGAKEATEATEPGVQMDEDGTFTTAVFDTSEDAGKLTARYLYTKNCWVAGGDLVKPGDCVVYTSPEGLIMMIDCSNQADFNLINEQLQLMGVDHIDIFVMSHPHADHIGSFLEVAKNYPIGQVYKNAHEYDSGTYSSAMRYIEENNIPCTVLKEGDSFMFGEQVEVKVYSPADGWSNGDVTTTTDANDLSLAMRITYGESSFWTAGDLYTTGEESIIEKYGDEVKSDVVKLNHHGNDTSNGREFVEFMEAKVAVAQFESVASQTVAMRYVKSGAKIFFGCMDGAVRVSTTGDGNYDVQTSMIREQTLFGEPSADCHYVIEE